MYKIDGVDISVFGVVPVKKDGILALNGVFDLPKRKGATEYNWGTSIEPFVSVDDIQLEGRNLTLFACIKAPDYKQKLDLFTKACVACRELWTRFGKFRVLVKDEIIVEEHVKLGLVFVTVKFWQEEYVLPVLSVEPSGVGITLDNYGLEADFGIRLSSRKNDKNEAKRIEINTTLPYTRTAYRDAKDAMFSCFMWGNDLDILYDRMMQFYSLCMRPGLREFRDMDNNIYTLYFKDGITVKVALNTLLTFDLKCRVVP